MKHLMHRTVVCGLAGVVGLAMTGVCLAEFKFDPSNGVGIIDKESVQFAVGWNDRKFQAQADTLQFSYVEQFVAVVLIVNAKGEEDLLETDVAVIWTIAHEVLRGGETKDEVTGFSLLGFDTKFPQVVLIDLPKGWEYLGDPGELFVKFPDKGLFVSAGKKTARIATFED